MVRLAIEGDDTFEVSDVEIQRSGPSYTVDTVQAFRSEFGDEIELCWLIGGDSLAELHTWYQIDRLASLCRLVTAVRPGFEQPDLTELEGMLGREKVQELRRDILSTPRIDISATHLRERVGKSVSIRYHTPRSVETYIQDNRLYRE
jgi:nicotinate-nucleotide adenylyltransferase